MASDQFGVQLDDLDKLKKDWHAASERVGEISKKLDEMKSTIARAAATDLAAAAAMVGPALVASLSTGYEVLSDVKAIQAQADELAQAQKELTSNLAADARKLEAVAAEYARVERKNHEALKKLHKHHSAPEGPHHSGTGGSSSSGGSGGGGGGGGGGSTNTSSDSFDNKGDGKWRTVGNWDAWKPGTHHTTEGAGVITAPDTSGLSNPRREIIDRAMERINHRIGYSQSATTNGYRDDCSGFVSAAWGLQPPGTNTYGLMGSQCSHQITKDDLRPGDALIAGDHVVLFGGWANSSHTEYIALEDNGSQGTVSHVIPYPYYSGDAASERAGGHPYLPYRRNGLQ